MLSRLSQVLNAADEATPNGAALIGFYGRNMSRTTSRPIPGGELTDRRIHRVA